MCRQPRACSLHTLCFSLFLFLSVREEHNHCRAEPLQTGIVDNQALIQQVSSHSSKPESSNDHQVFSPLLAALPGAQRPHFLLLISLKAVPLQEHPGVDYSEAKPQGSKPQSQWCKWLGQVVPPALGGAAYRGTSRLRRQVLPEPWGWVKSSFAY